MSLVSASAEPKKDRPAKKSRILYDDLTTGIQANFVPLARWDDPDLTYGFVNGTADIASSGEWAAVQEALAIWAGPPPLTFTEVSAGIADIPISWVTGDHGDGYPFDGTDGTLAHAFEPPWGDVHFDDDETWTLSTRPNASQPIDLVTVALHELGHSLGLGHSSDPSSVMWKYYEGSHRYLGSDDVAGILYHYPNHRYMFGISKGTGIESWSQAQGTISRADVVATGDVTGDGKADVVAVENAGGGEYRYMLGTSNGSKVSSWTQLLGGMTGPAAMGLGDVTGDGKADVVAVEPAGLGKYRYMLGVSKGTGIESWTEILSGMSATSQFDLGDVSGDGKADIVAVESAGGGKYRYMLGTSKGTESPSWKEVLSGMSAATEMEVGDVTGDGKADVVAVEAEGGFKYRYMLGVSKGTGIESWGEILKGMSASVELDVGDVSGDGKADIVAVESAGSGKYRYMLGTSKGSGSPSWASLLTGMSFPWGMAVGDVNADGKFDVIGLEEY